MANFSIRYDEYIGISIHEVPEVAFKKLKGKLTDTRSTTAGKGVVYKEVNVGNIEITYFQD